jgi:hypothetical protein
MAADRDGAPTLPTALITMPTPHGDDVANGRGRPICMHMPPDAPRGTPEGASRPSMLLKKALDSPYHAGWDYFPARGFSG